MVPRPREENLRLFGKISSDLSKLVTTEATFDLEINREEIGTKKKEAPGHPDIIGNIDPDGSLSFLVGRCGYLPTKTFDRVLSNCLEASKDGGRIEILVTGKYEKTDDKKVRIIAEDIGLDFSYGDHPAIKGMQESNLIPASEESSTRSSQQEAERNAG